MRQGVLFLVLAAASVVPAAPDVGCGADPATKTLRGVVTYHLIPAKAMRINEIVSDPEPGTSYIGDEGILVELGGIVDVEANWTVVEVEYCKYREPKTISYELLGEQHELIVDYRALSVIVDGDISDYIEQ